MFIVGYLLAIVCLVLFIPWLFGSLFITNMRDILTPSQTPPPQNTNRTVETPFTARRETADRCPPQDEEIEFYNYMRGDEDEDPHTVSEEDKNFVFPRIKVK